MSLRAAVPSDLAAIMKLERASFPTDAWSEAMMREELVSPHGWYVVDEEADRIVGYAGLRAVRRSTDADVQTIALAEEMRGRGRGRALLRALLEEAARRGVTAVFLEVRADNPVAHGLYASEGFIDIGRKPRYYQPDDVDAVVMKLDVRSWAGARHPSPDPADSADSAGDESRIRKPDNRTLSGSPAPGDPETRADSGFRIGGGETSPGADSGFRIGGGGASPGAAWQGGACT